MVSINRSLSRTSENEFGLEQQSIDGFQVGNESSTVSRRRMRQMAATFATTLAVYAIFLVQGVLLARVLGPVGRGEFGTAVFFPRDILLYVGLLGGLEIVNRYASQGTVNSINLKYAAAKLGLVSGVITGLAGAVLAVIVLSLVDGGAKAYLLPFCFLVCLFVPGEHIHLTVSGVDRGREAYARYNWNRLIFAASFPVLLVVLVLCGGLNLAPTTLLTMVCGLFVVSRLLGLLPTLRGMRLLDWIRGQRISTSASEVPTSKDLLREGRPYAFSMLATELFERLDVLLILLLATVHESGFYFVAVPAAALLTIAPNALSVFTFNAGAEGRRIGLNTALGIMAATALFQLAATICLAVIVPWLIIALYDAPFGPSIDFVLYLLPAAAMKGFLQAADGYLKGCGKPMIGVGARAISIFAMLGFVVIAYPHFQLLAIPLSACVGQGISMVIISTAVIHHIRNHQGVAKESPSWP